MNGNARVLNTGGQSFIKVGAGTTSNQYAYIDFVGGTTYTGYGLRVIRNNSGPNTSSVIYHRGIGELSFRTIELGPLTFHMNNLERMRVHTNGKVGIGTSSPVNTLQINNATQPQVGLSIAGTTALRLQTTSAGSYIDSINKDLVFRSGATGNAEAVRITNAANVGIGTNSPSEKLHISGTGECALISPMPYATNQDEPYLIAGTTNYTGASTNWGTYGFQHRLKSNAGGVGRVTIDGAIGATQTELFSVCVTSTEPRVGIGTTDTPGQNLHIASTQPTIRLQDTDGTNQFADIFQAADSLYIESRNNTVDGQIVFRGRGNGAIDEYARFNTNGYLGIGTSAPAEELHIAGSTPTIQLQDTDGTNQYTNIYHNGGGVYLEARNGTNKGYVLFRGYDGTNPQVEYARFTPNGYLGIGTFASLGTDPTVPLHIAADDPIDARIRIQDGDGTDQYSDFLQSAGALYIDSRNNTNNGPIIFRGVNGSAIDEYGRFTSTGNLGVGVSSPTEKLHVAGNILATGSISSSSAGIGIAAPVKSTVQIKGAGQQGSLTDSGNTDNILRLGANGNAAGDGGALSFACNASDTASSVGYAAVKGLVRNASNNGTGHISFQTRTTSTNTSFTEKARITSDGAFYTHLIPSITTSTIQGLIGSKGYLSLQGTNGSTFANPWNFYWTGTALQAWIDGSNQGNVTFTSDYRTKREITTQTESGIDKVKLLRPVTFKRAAFGDLFVDEDVVREGFIAHEVGEVIPSGCEGEKDAENQIQSLNIDAIVSVLTKALQETIAKVEQLEAQLAALQP